MNRRDFLQVLAATSLGPVIAKLAVPAAPALFTTPSMLRFKDTLDWGHQTRLTGSKFVGEVKYRHSLMLPTATWKAFTDEQREETWAFLEQTIDRHGRREPDVLTRAHVRHLWNVLNTTAVPDEDGYYLVPYWTGRKA